MSLKFPHDRARARQDEGEQPYQDARRAMGEQNAELQARAEEFGERTLRESDEDRAERLRTETEDRLRGIHDEIAASDNGNPSSSVASSAEHPSSLPFDLHHSTNKE